MAVTNDNMVLVGYFGEIDPSVRTAFQAMQDGLAKVDQGAQSNFRSFGMLDRVLGSHAARVFGLNYGYGIFAEELSRFALGGAVTTGVLAGVLALAEAWKALGDDTDTTAKEFESAVKSMQSSTEHLVKANKDGMILMERNQAESLLRMAEARVRDMTNMSLWAASITTAMRHLGIPEGLIPPATKGQLFPDELRQAEQQVASLQASIDRLNAALGEESASSVKSMERENAAIIRQLELRDQQIKKLDALRARDLFGGLVSGQGILQALPTAGLVGAGTETAQVLGPAWDQALRSLTNEQMFQGIKAGAKRADESVRLFNDAIVQAMQKQQDEAQRNWREFGQRLGDAFVSSLVDAIRKAANLGDALKSLFFTALKIAADFGIKLALNAAFPGAGSVVGAATDAAAAGEGAVVASGAARAPAMDFSSFPQATNPLAAARDADWQSFLRESSRIATRDGFR